MKSALRTEVLFYLEMAAYCTFYVMLTMFATLPWNVYEQHVATSVALKDYYRLVDNYGDTVCGWDEWLDDVAGFDSGECFVAVVNHTYDRYEAWYYKIRDVHRLTAALRAHNVSRIALDATNNPNPIVISGPYDSPTCARKATVEQRGLAMALSCDQEMKFDNQI